MSKSEDFIAKLNYLSPIKIGDYIKYRYSKSKKTDEFSYGYVTYVDVYLPMDKKEDKACYTYRVHSLIKNGFLSREDTTVSENWYEIIKVDPVKEGFKQAHRICPLTRAMCDCYRAFIVNGERIDKYACRLDRSTRCDRWFPLLSAVKEIPTMMSFDELVKPEVENNIKYWEDTNKRWDDKHKHDENLKKQAEEVMNRIIKELKFDNNLIKFNSKLSDFINKEDIRCRETDNLNQLYQLDGANAYDYDDGVRYVFDFHKVNINLTSSTEYITLWVKETNLDWFISNFNTAFRLYPRKPKYLKGNYCYEADKTCTGCFKHECLSDSKNCIDRIY